MFRMIATHYILDDNWNTGVRMSDPRPIPKRQNGKRQWKNRNKKKK